MPTPTLQQTLESVTGTHTEALSDFAYHGTYGCSVQLCQGHSWAERLTTYNKKHNLDWWGHSVYLAEAVNTVAESSAPHSSESLCVSFCPLLLPLLFSLGFPPSCVQILVFLIVFLWDFVQNKQNAETREFKLCNYLSKNNIKYCLFELLNICWPLSKLINTFLICHRIVALILNWISPFTSFIFVFSYY